MATRASKYLQKEGHDPSTNNLDFYPTPQPFCDAAVHMVRTHKWEDEKKNFFVLDAGCGTGN